MGIAERKQTVYETSDGKIFSSKRDAIDHENQIQSIKWFFVSFSPDLTEGRGFQSHAYIAVNAKTQHMDFAEYAIAKKLGPRFSFCQGVFGSQSACLC